MKRILSIVFLAFAILAGCTKEDFQPSFSPHPPVDTTKPPADTTKPPIDTTKPPTAKPAPYGDVEAPYVVVSLLQYNNSVFKMEKYRVDGSFRAKHLDDYFTGNHFIDNPDFSAKGDKFCYAEGGIFVLDVNTKQRTQVRNVVEGAYESTEMSPDGSKIAYLSWNADFSLDLNVIAPNGESDPMKLTNYENTMSSAGPPSFSPDGNRIAVSEYPHIMVMDWNGNNRIRVHEIEDANEFTWYPIFNKEGNRLIYFYYNQYNGASIVSAGIEENGSNRLMLISDLAQYGIGFPSYSVLSEDGSVLYFVAASNGYTSLFKVPVAGGVPARVAFNVTDSDGYLIVGLDYVER